MAPHPKQAALAVLPQRGSVLLVRRRNDPDAGLWGYPGGHIEAGETALQAAARELREETSVIAEPVRHLTTLEVVSRDDAGAVRYHFHLLAILCRYLSGTPRAADDALEAQWIAVEDVLGGKLAMSRNVDTVLRNALDG